MNFQECLPVLPGERVNDLLLGSLLAANLQALVLADSHTSETKLLKYYDLHINYYPLISKQKSEVHSHSL